jgi:hypothetical protein
LLGATRAAQAALLAPLGAARAAQRTVQVAVGVARALVGAVGTRALQHPCVRASLSACAGHKDAQDVARRVPSGARQWARTCGASGCRRATAQPQAALPAHLKACDEDGHRAACARRRLCVQQERLHQSAERPHAAGRAAGGRGVGRPDVV